jgi:KDO2-lipid IV(A) lauroyltransferase
LPGAQVYLRNFSGKIQAALFYQNGVPALLIPSHKKFLRAIGRNTLFISRWVISRLPYPAFRILTPFFVAIGRPFIKRKKSIVLENLHTAFGGEKTEQEINGILDRYFDNIGFGMIELIYFLDRPKKIMEKVTIEGKENLDEALNKGRGAILLSAHFGDFILMYLRVALAGYKTNCIMRRMKDAQFEEYISDYLNKNGVRKIYSLPHRQCVARSLKSLHDNQILFILLDQNYGEDGGVFVDFFGQPAATATGPVVFSQRSGAPILPVFIVRDGTAGRHKIIIDPPVKLEAAQDEQSGLTGNTAQLTKIIEGYIRSYPHEWGGWMHRRWKSKMVPA